jgi:hypothetical protein
MRDEDALRAALRSLESRAPDPAAVLAAARAGGPARRNPHPARQKILAAVAAATAVTVIVTGVVALTGHPGTRPAPGTGPGCRPPAYYPFYPLHPPSPAGFTSPGRSAGPAGHQAAGLIPPYYIALTGTRRPYPANPDNAAVYSSVTGARLATVTPPRPYRTFVDVSAAADDRTFALAAQNARTQRSGTPVVFFLLHFSPGTRQARLTLIAAPAVPAHGSFDAFALSPDGRKLAVAWDTNGAHPATRLQVTDLVTGKGRDWTSARGDVEGDTADPWSISWAADSRTLAFNWITFPVSRSAVTGPGTGLRALDTAAAGTDLQECSRLLLPFLGPGRRIAGGDLDDILFLTPSGRHAVGAISTDGKAGYAVIPVTPGDYIVHILDLRKVSASEPGGPRDVLWANADGSVLVVYSPAGHNDRIGVLVGGRLRLLPQSSRISFPAAAW